MKKIVYILSVAIAAAACSKAEYPANTPAPQDPTTGKVEFSAIFGEAPVVKSEISGTSVLWKEGDEISIIWDGGKTTAQADAAGEKANFEATVDQAAEYFAVYPSKASVFLTESTLAVGIPAEQNGAFEDANIAIARTSDRTLVFKNLCALGKVTLSRNDIAKVVFKSNNEQNLAGNATLSLDNNGVPTVVETSSPVDSIVLTPAAGDAFAAGSYYFAAIPSALDEGVSFTLTTISGNTILGKASANATSLVRSEALNFGTLDNVANVNTLQLRFIFGPEAGAKAIYDPEDNWPNDYDPNQKEGVSYPYTINGIDYNFFVKDLTDEGKCKWNSNDKNGYADRIGIPSSTVFFGLPALEGYKLTNVVVGQSRRGAGDNAETKITTVGITDHVPSESDQKSYIAGGELQNWPGWAGSKDKKVVDHVFQLTDTKENTIYYLNSDNASIGLYFARLVLTYEKVTE